MKCAFCGADVIDPQHETIGGKEYVFHAAACAESFKARASSVQLAKAGGIVAILGGAISLYSASTASSMTGAAGGSSATVGWPLVVLGFLVMLTGIASLVEPTKIPMRLGGGLMLIYGALMVIIFLSGELSFALVAMNADTTWMMLVLGVAMLVFGMLMLGMEGGMGGPAAGGVKGVLTRLGTYSTVIAVVVILTIGGIAASNVILAPAGGAQMPTGNQTTSMTTTTTMTTGTTTTTSTTVSQSTAGPRVWVVQIAGDLMSGGYYFQPNVITISLGDTVNWTCISGTHTVTSDPNQASYWNSGTLNPGQSYAHTFTIRGNFTYQSITDSGVSGTVIVT